MPDADAQTEQDSATQPSDPAIDDAVQATESYETDEGVVFYDVENPLAWIQAGEVLDLDESA